MRWGIDWLLRKFYSLSKKLFSVFLKIIFWVFKSIFVSFYRFFFATYYLLPLIFGPLYPLLCSFLVYLIDFLLFFFISIPRFFYYEFFKPFLLSFSNLTLSFVGDYSFLTNFFKYVFFYCSYVYTHTLNSLYRFYVRFYKVVIDFLYFDVYRNRHKILNFIHIFLINLVRFFLVYFFFI